MKKLLSILVILAVIFGIIYLFKQALNTSNNSTNNLISASHPDPSNATFTFDEGLITLKNGVNQTPIVPNSATVIETTLTNTIEYGDINNDKKNDAVMFIIQDGGGSGVFTYIAGFVSGPLNYKGTNAVLIGDRLKPESISIKDEVITVTYWQRLPDQPFSVEPSLKTSQYFIYKNGRLIDRPAQF